MSKDFKKIYFFRPGAFGDILISAPLFYKIKTLFPNSDLILISEQGTRLNHVTAKMVVDLIPEIKQTILYPNVSTLSKFSFFKKNIDFKEKIAIVYLNYSRCKPIHVFRDYVFFKSIGFKHTFSFFNYYRNSHISKKYFIPEIQRLFNITVDLTGSNILPKDFVLNKTNILIKNKYKIFSAPFGKATSKRWPIERYNKLYSELASLGYEICICGSMDEEKDFIKIGWSDKLYIKGFFGLQFKDLVDKIKDCVIYIGNDTGPMHLAALLKIDCIALFSDTNRDSNWSPFGSNNIILRTNVECGNCQSEICLNSTHDCMNNISYETVRDVVINKLKKNG
jgi:ADP-heptose:LPS heptosyltransferase